MQDTFAPTQRQKSTKRSRLIRPNAACITDSEFRSQLVEKEELSKKKKQEVILRREKAEQNKLARAAAKEAAAQKRSLKEARKQAQARAKAIEVEKKATKKRNKENKICYICDGDSNDFDAKTVRTWRFCDECGLWCCVFCLPLSYTNESVQPKSFFCNNCVSK